MRTSYSSVLRFAEAYGYTLRKNQYCGKTDYFYKYTLKKDGVTLLEDKQLKEIYSYLFNAEYVK